MVNKKISRSKNKEKDSEYCTFEIPLYLSNQDKETLNELFGVQRKYYNEIITYLKDGVFSDKKYAYLKQLYAITKKDSQMNKSLKRHKIKQLNNLFNLFKDAYYINSQFSFLKGVSTPTRHRGFENLPSTYCQTACNEIYSHQVKSFLDGKCKKIKYKKFSELNVIYSGSNTDAIMISKKVNDKRYTAVKSFEEINKDTDIVISISCINRKVIRVKTKLFYDLYSSEILDFSDYRYLKLVRKFSNNEFKYYIQVLAKDKRPPKRIEKTGDFRFEKVSENSTAIDIGVNNVAWVSKDSDGNLVDINIEPLMDVKAVRTYRHKDKELQRKIERSRRINNPHCFASDGTWTKGQKLKVYSKNYNALLNKKRTLSQQFQAARKNNHQRLANQIVYKYGANNVIIEDMNYQQIQKKKVVDKNDNRDNAKKTHYGREISKYAPYMFIMILNQKLIEENKDELHRINTFDSKATQYEFDKDIFVKKVDSQRTINLGGYIIQRDILAAFNLAYFDDETNTYDREAMFKNFPKLIELQNSLIDKLLEKGDTCKSIGLNKLVKQTFDGFKSELTLNTETVEEFAD